MLSVNFRLFVTLFLLTIRGVSCEELTPVKNEEFALEDSSVTLSYKYSKQATGSDEFYWYRQYPGKPPELLIFHLGTQNATNSRWSAKVSDDKTQMDLLISSAAVTDSAVYYCAVRPYSKITFGQGIKLIVNSKEEYKPSYYKLEGGATDACLATGFSRENATKLDTENKDLFNKTEAVRISEDSLFNQVALFNATTEGDKCPESTEEDSCEDTFRPGPTENTITVTIMILRLIFFKTIVFNVVMTLRLWISQ